MSRRGPVARSVAVVAVPGVACVTWLATARIDQRGDYYLVGPFHLPVALEAAVALAVFCAVAMVTVTSSGRTRAHRTVATGLERSSVGLLLFATFVATFAWRVITSRSGGANIGGGMALSAAPIGVAMLLIVAVTIERRHANISVLAAVAYSVAVISGAVALTMVAHYLL